MRIGASAWHSSKNKVPNATIAKFSKPTEIKTRANYFTVMQASGYLQFMKYGADIDNTWTAIANASAFEGQFKVGDLFWVDGEKPVKETEEAFGIGASANAVVKSVAYGDKYITITLERNKHKKS